VLYGDPDAGDAHCGGACGSLLYSIVRDGAFVHVTLGTLVDDPTTRPTAHIFVGSKAPWFTITDELPQYENSVDARRRCEGGRRRHASRIAPRPKTLRRNRVASTLSQG
jgi:hypothetical protein